MTATELQATRRELGYSIPVLAEILGMDSRRLKAWECGDEPIAAQGDLETAFRALRRVRRQEWPSLPRPEDCRV